MPILLDFSQSQDTQFEPWPVGEPQEFTIFGIEQKVGKDSKQPYLEIAFKHADSNRRAWRNFSLQPQALWALKRLLIELGADKDDFTGTFDFEPNDYLGLPVLLTFGPETEYNGQTRQEVVDVKGNV